MQKSLPLGSFKDSLRKSIFASGCLNRSTLIKKIPLSLGTLFSPLPSLSLPLQVSPPLKSGISPSPLPTLLHIPFFQIVKTHFCRQAKRSPTRRCLWRLVIFEAPSWTACENKFCKKQNLAKKFWKYQNPETLANPTIPLSSVSLSTSPQTKARFSTSLAGVDGLVFAAQRRPACHRHCRHRNRTRCLCSHRPQLDWMHMKLPRVPAVDLALLRPPPPDGQWRRRGEGGQPLPSSTAVDPHLLRPHPLDQSWKWRS